MRATEAGGMRDLPKNALPVQEQANAWALHALAARVQVTSSQLYLNPVASVVVRGSLSHNARSVTELGILP